MAQVVSTAGFARDLKRLAKKYRSLEIEFPALVASLRDQPVQGISLGRNCYKIRLAIASKGRGKSGGARIITHVKIEQGHVYLLSIYDKSEYENLADWEIEALLVKEDLM